MPAPPVAPKERNGNSVQSVIVAARVLDAIALAGQPMGVSELARGMGESKARVHRHLATLKTLGFVDQEGATERYRLGWKLFQLGDAAAGQYDLRRIAEPFMVQLRDAVSETVVLGAVLNGETMILHAVECKARRVSISIRPGDRPQPHSSAQARIALAFADGDARNRVLARKALSPTPHSLASAEDVNRRLDLIRERLYDSAPGHYMIGINTLAMPLFRDRGVLAGTIAIIGSVQFIPEPPDPKQVREVREAAAKISRCLGSDRYDAPAVARPRAVRGSAPRGNGA